MIIDFILPDIGEGIVECEIVEWLVQEGDQIEADQAIVEVMTDKAVVQIPAINPGTVVKLYHQKGEIAKVHGPLFSVDEAGEAAEATSTPEPIKSEAPQATAAVATAVAPAVPGQKALATPAVRRLGREQGIDLSQVQGSGKDGRILKEDLLQFKAGTAPAAALQVSTEAPKANRVEPIRGIRMAMAKRMAESASTIPHFTYGEEIDLTGLVSLRKQLKPRMEKMGVRLTLMPFFMKALALAIQEYPILNSKVNAEVTEITYYDRVNIGMAVDTPLGLLVPNIKDVQKLSILEIAGEVNRLAETARAGKISPDDLQGGTITISNIGALGGTFTTPIINKPEVAIVALGKTQILPRFSATGAVEARNIMQSSWSGDHRVIDGGTIARFCTLWKDFLEDPSLMLLHLS